MISQNLTYYEKHLKTPTENKYTSNVMKTDVATHQGDTRHHKNDFVCTLSLLNWPSHRSQRKGVISQMCCDENAEATRPFISHGHLIITWFVHEFNKIISILGDSLSHLNSENPPTDYDEIQFRVMKPEHDTYISFCSCQFEMKLKSSFIEFVIAKLVFLFTKRINYWCTMWCMNIPETFVCNILNAMSI